jgi:hypothetical protein
MGWLVDKDRATAAWGEDDNLLQIVGNHTQVTGVLAGFSITIVVLISTFELERGYPPQDFLEQATLGMFMVAFFGYVAAGVLYSVVAARLGLHRHFLFSAAGVLYYQSVLLSFSALLPLLGLIGAFYLNLAIVCVIVGAAVGGYIAICIPLVDLLRLRRRLCLVIFAAALSITGVYLGLGLQFPVLQTTELILQANLLVSIFVAALTFLVCLLSFFLKTLEHEIVVPPLAALIAFAGTSIVVYSSTVSILFLSRS